MSAVLMTVPAHFDCVQVRLDVEVDLKPDTPLLVTILSEELPQQALVWNATQSSSAAFARVWDNNEDAIYDSL
jgi:hypothetical protein